ncbi:DNA-binding response regulator, OmpR family, contains REC and winged-helix (wHTH) domain [Proteiniborus ethanoligenes]|uniref:Stage 0 sporulation protein A homolog n=1 Tax=Proteiniborus ethanoligenes TaxID=415015 RepID=A0A1H3KRU8_9FIRM|nr:response regulator transcription factor [Proteiniborus ethanoligenes]TAH64085.1 MAG: response regulator transcription factor [Gottschalkiaceae bacterium]SDY54841.1 DNA-binding response regulator, OmpR family, contains REC and winged-helix (wHTH) domain [Proteiniborus ethanoligenes]
MERILIIEDEEKIARFIELELKYEGYEVEKAFNGRDGLELATTQPFDLVLLDVMLPALNGLEVLRRIRKASDLPVILLTARDAVVDKVTGLDGGADDYITKPFAIEELLARIRATLRKKAAVNVVKTSSELSAGTLRLDPIRREVQVDGSLLDLTKREFDLLNYLLENKNIVVTRETLLQHIWGYDFSGGTNAVDVYIRYLRAKIEEPFGLKLLHTVRGVGYVIKDE